MKTLMVNTTVFVANPDRTKPNDAVTPYYESLTGRYYVTTPDGRKWHSKTLSTLLQRVKVYNEQCLRDDPALQTGD